MGQMADKKATAKRIATDEDYRALAEFRHHISRYLDSSDEAAKAAGIEPRQYQLLLAIRGLPPDVEPTIGALAHQLRSRHHSTVELVNRAEANDFVQRVRAGSYVLVQLTRKGDRVLSRAVEQRLKELRIAGPVLVNALQQLIKVDRAATRKRSAKV